VDSERVRYAGGERLHDTWRVENDRNGHGKYHELHESGDLTSEEEEDGYDPDDTENNGPNRPCRYVTRPCVLKATGAIAAVR